MIKLYSYLICDNCKKRNPPVTKAGNNRVTLCCLTEKGLYTVSESELRSIGKTIRRTIYLRWPFKNPFYKYPF